MRVSGFAAVFYGVLSLFSVWFSSAVASEATVGASGSMLVTASAVRMREAADTQAPLVGQLGLGAVVEAVKRTEKKQSVGSRSQYWFLVKTPEHKGWVFGAFLQDFSVAAQDKQWFTLAKTRLAMDKLSFADRVDLYDFIERVLPQVKSPAYEGGLALGKVLALQKAFDKVHFGNQNKEPYAAFVRAHKDKAFLDEIQGVWLVPAQRYWDLADQYAKTKAGDEIAWYAADANLGGECEGDISCGLGRESMTYGEYLKRFPQGKHVSDALKQLNDTFDYILNEALKYDPDYFKIAGDSGGVLKELRAIVGVTSPKAAGRDKALASLDKIYKNYKRFH